MTREETEAVLERIGREQDDRFDLFEAALTCGRPALIELRVDPEALTPRQTLTEIREQAQARRSG